MSLDIGSRLGVYEILARIGAGGMGEVYRARDTKLGREVALKTLPRAFAADADRMARFQREAQVLAALNHPHIAAIYGLEDSGEVTALVMELVDGPTLDSRIAQGPIPPEEALALAREIAEAVEAAHEKGIVHRDLKPANIKLTADGKVKVLDFGLAKAVETERGFIDPANSPTLTLAATGAGVILGTAAYMSPEQAKGKAVDRRADIWAFGVVLMEMLTGRQMYKGETAPETLAAVIMKEPGFDALPGSVPAPIRQLLRRCLEKDPRRRLRDIGEARIAIEDALSGKFPAAETVTAAPVVRRQRFAPWIAAVICFLLAAVLAFLHFRRPAPEVHAVRFQISPPENLTFADLTQRGPVLISPDGMRVTFAVDNPPQLWLRPLNSLAAHPIPGTENASYPFWSSDSRHIGFFADGKLKRVAISGGPPQTLCAAPSGRGGAWSGGGDGMILFAADATVGLSRIPAAGGEPVLITAPEKAAGIISHRQPHFLPDGRHFLYVGASTNTSESRVMMAELPPGAGKPAVVSGKQIMNGDAHVCWTPPGFILFVRERNLMAQKFDLGTIRFTGEPVLLAENVTLGGLRSTADFSVSDNGVLVYGSGTASVNRITWFDRQGKLQEALDTRDSFRHVALSPDGKMLAAESTQVVNSALNLWIFDLARQTPSRFTFEPFAQSGAVWSADSKTLYYAWLRENSWGLYRKSVSGVGSPELLLPLKRPVRSSDISPGGDWLIYEEIGENGKNVIWALPLRDGRPAPEAKPVRITQPDFGSRNGVISRDGKFIAYSSTEAGRSEIYVRSFNPETPASGGKWQVSASGGFFPFWSRDGKELFFQSPDNKLMVVSVTPAGGFQASVPVPLFELHAQGYCVSADGKRIVAAVQLSGTKAAAANVVLNWTAELGK